MKLDEKKADKKRRMMAAAFECFNEKGFMNTAINDICTKAGVAKGTFYLYFDDKNAIYDDLVDHCSKLTCERIYSALYDSSDVSAEELMISILDEMIAQGKEQSVMFRFLGTDLKWPSLSDDSNDLIMRMRSSLDHITDEARKQKDLRMMLELLYTYTGIIHASLTRSEPADPEICREDLIRMTHLVLNQE